MDIDAFTSIFRLFSTKNPPCISGVGSTPGKDQLLIGDVSILVFETIITVPGLLGINVA